MTNYRALLYLVASAQLFLAFLAGFFSYRAFSVAKKRWLGRLILGGYAIIGLHLSNLFLNYSQVYVLPLRPYDRFIPPLIGLCIIVYVMYQGTKLASSRSAIIEVLSVKQNAALDNLEKAGQRFDEASKKV